MTAYPMGARVVFADATATTSTGDEGMVEGFINGPVLDEEDGTVRFVPVWAERDNGREATTVFVAVENILSVEDPQ